jgi:L-rhamnose mutarotase
MNHVGQVLRLKPGCYAGYKKGHDDFWPDMRELFDNEGVSMAIFRHGDLLYVHGMVPSAEAWQRIGAAEVIARWNQFMAQYLVTDSDGVIERDMLEPTFLFGKFAQ